MISMVAGTVLSVRGPFNSLPLPLVGSIMNLRKDSNLREKNAYSLLQGFPILLLVHCKQAVEFGKTPSAI